MYLQKKFKTRKKGWLLSLYWFDLVALKKAVWFSGTRWLAAGHSTQWNQNEKFELDLPQSEKPDPDPP
jgi:hypothetical protein